MIYIDFFLLRYLREQQAAQTKSNSGEKNHLVLKFATGVSVRQSASAPTALLVCTVNTGLALAHFSLPQFRSPM